MVTPPRHLSSDSKRFFDLSGVKITPLLVEEGQFVKVTAEASAIKNNLLSHSNDRITFKAIPQILPEFVG